jgi:hypothetical protein
MIRQIAILPGAAVRPPDAWAHREVVRVDFPTLPADRICSRCFTRLRGHEWVATDGSLVVDCSKASA